MTENEAAIVFNLSLVKRFVNEIEIHVYTRSFSFSFSFSLPLFKKTEMFLNEKQFA